MRPFVHERSAPAADSAPPARATIPHVRAKIAPQVAESAVRSCAASTRARELPRRDQAFFLNLAIPHLAADLRPSGAQLLWIVDIYGFPLAGFLIAMGTLGDRIGRRAGNARRSGRRGRSYPTHEAKEPAHPAGPRVTSSFE